MRPSTLFAAALVGAIAFHPLLAGAAPPPQPVRHVAIVVYDGTEILDFAGPAEVLAAAGGFASGGSGSALDVYTVGATTAPIKAQGFITITPQYSIADAPTPDIVVIPGGNSANLSRDPAMMTWLTTVTSASDATLTVCTGAFPLAESGALDGLEITTWYGAVESLRAKAPRAKVMHGRRFIDSGRYITTAGVSAGIDGALHLTARLYGRRVADQTARYMEYHWTPEPYLAQTYAYWNPSTDDRGRALQAAQLAVEEGRTQEAIAAYKKLTAGDRSGSAWLGLGNSLFHAKDRKNAIVAYKNVKPGQPAYQTAVYNLACAYALEGNKPQALAAIKKAFASGIKPSQALADADLAAIHAEIVALKP
jgi:transcriptional regulator GlxA family with amidase domain